MGSNANMMYQLRGGPNIAWRIVNADDISGDFGIGLSALNAAVVKKLNGDPARSESGTTYIEPNSLGGCVISQINPSSKISGYIQITSNRIKLLSYYGNDKFILADKTTFNSSIIGDDVEVYNKLLVEIDGDLFFQMDDLKAINSLFYRSSITHIPSGLLRNNFLLNSATNAFRLSGLLESIGGKMLPNLLSSNPSIPLSFNGMFYGCSGLTSIPSDILSLIPNRANVSVSQMFLGCSGVTGNVPRLWETHPDVQGFGCFSGCVNAANYADIPVAWR